MRIEKADPSPEAASIGRTRNTDDAQIVFWDQTLAMPGGQTHAEAGIQACTEPVVRLRLKRTAATLAYYWGPGAEGDNWNQVHECKFGTEPIKLVRLTAITGRQPCDVDIRFINLRIRSGPTTPPRPRRILLLAAVFAAAWPAVWGIAFWLRRKHPDSTPAA